MGIFHKSNYIVNTGIIWQVFQCTANVILLAKMIQLWTLYCFVVITILKWGTEDSVSAPLYFMTCTQRTICLLYGKGGFEKFW